MKQRTKQWITTVDRSLLSLEERKLRRIFMDYPKLTLEQAKEVLEHGPKVLKKAEPKIEEPVKEVVVEKKAAPKPKPKPKAKPKAKAKPRAKKK